MKPFLRPLFTAALLVACALLFGAGTLHAQLSKIFVASTGNDANDGSRGSPKRNFQAAHDAVAAGGQIVVLDTAGYGKLVITKSLSITVPPGVNGFVTVTGDSDGITINATASDVVVLRGLILEGGELNPGSGINATTVGNLTVEDCTVRNFNTGIKVQPTTAAKCYFHRCTLRACRFGLDVETSAAVAVIAVASGCRVEKDSDVGVEAAAGVSGSSVDLTLADCVLSGNGFAIESFNFGISTVVRVDNCRITGNISGPFAGSGGQILSRGNNTLEHNGNTNTFPGTYSAK